MNGKKKSSNKLNCLIYKEEFTMANAKDFVIHEGVLIKYKGYTVREDFAIPEDITGIGNNVFSYRGWDCERLVIPKSVETIGNKAFAYMNPDSVLKEIVIQGDIKEIGKSAFSSIYVEKIIFEGHVDKVCEEAFAYCRINTLTVAGGDSFSGSRCSFFAKQSFQALVEP